MPAPNEVAVANPQGLGGLEVIIQTLILLLDLCFWQIDVEHTKLRAHRGKTIFFSLYDVAVQAPYFGHYGA
jgi:hypothetical protein